MPLDKNAGYDNIKPLIDRYVRPSVSVMLPLNRKEIY
jgi:hypothetical protein